MVANHRGENLNMTSRANASGGVRQGMSENQMSDDEAQRKLDHGDKATIDKQLDDLSVSKTSSGKDQTAKPDTEGSNSSSKNLDEQND